MEPPLLMWLSALQPLELIPEESRRGNWSFPVPKRQQRKQRVAFLPVRVKGILTGLLSIHAKPLTTCEDCSAHHSHSSPSILRGALDRCHRDEPLPHLIFPVLPSEFVKVTSKQLSPGPRAPGVSPWHLPIPDQPCQVEGAGLLGSGPPEQCVLSVTLGLSAALPPLSANVGLWG